LSSVSPAREDSPSEVVAGLIAAASIFVSLAAIAYRPLRLVPVAIVLALVATAIGGRHARLAGFAVAVGGVAFVLGLTVAVLTEHPLW
jgi:hypothetical protein